MKNALEIFEAIPTSQHPSLESIVFADYDLHDTFSPSIYSLDGNDVKPRGPIRVTEVRRRKRVRFVRVDFFEWVTAPTGHTVPKKYMSSYAWQGENSIHLLEAPNVYDVDPFGGDTEEEAGPTPKLLDAQHQRIMTLHGVKDSHLDLY